jgi:hypothetical protein
MPREEFVRHTNKTIDSLQEKLKDFEPAPQRTKRNILKTTAKIMLNFWANITTEDALIIEQPLNRITDEDRLKKVAEIKKIGEEYKKKEQELAILESKLDVYVKRAR